MSESSDMTATGIPDDVLWSRHSDECEMLQAEDNLGFELGIGCRCTDEWKAAELARLSHPEEDE